MNELDCLWGFLCAVWGHQKSVSKELLPSVSTWSHEIIRTFCCVYRDAGVCVCVIVERQSVRKRVGTLRERFAIKQHASCVWLSFPCLLTHRLFIVKLFWLYFKGFLNFLDKGGSE